MYKSLYLIWNKNIKDKTMAIKKRKEDKWVMRVILDVLQEILKAVCGRWIYYKKIKANNITLEKLLRISKTLRNNSH